jgi:hypothetical protein
MLTNWLLGLRLDTLPTSALVVSLHHHHPSVRRAVHPSTCASCLNLHAPGARCRGLDCETNFPASDYPDILEQARAAAAAAELAQPAKGLGTAAATAHADDGKPGAEGAAGGDGAVVAEGAETVGDHPGSGLPPRLQRWQLAAAQACPVRPSVCLSLSVCLSVFEHLQRLYVCRRTSMRVPAPPWSPTLRQRSAPSVCLSVCHNTVRQRSAAQQNEFSRITGGGSQCMASKHGR